MRRASLLSLCPVALRAAAALTNFVSRRATQNGLLPLHLAIMQGASEEVVTLLLNEDSKATFTPDKARTHPACVAAREHMRPS